MTVYDFIAYREYIVGHVHLTQSLNSA